MSSWPQTRNSSPYRPPKSKQGLSRNRKMRGMRSTRNKPAQQRNLGLPIHQVENRLLVNRKFISTVGEQTNKSNGYTRRQERGDIGQRMGNSSTIRRTRL